VTCTRAPATRELVGLAIRLPLLINPPTTRRPREGHGDGPARSRCLLFSRQRKDTTNGEDQLARLPQASEIEGKGPSVRPRPVMAAPFGSRIQTGSFAAGSIR